jgi:hypothetical protein
MRSFLGLLIMLVGPVFLFWLPVPGLAGLLAGLLGGYVVARPGRAVVLAILPFLLGGFVIAAASLGLGAGTGLPIIGFIGSAIAGLAAVWMIVHHLALILGALVGALLAGRNPGRSDPREERPRLPAPS